MKQESPIRMGLVGLGVVGFNHHVPALQGGNTGAILVATADPNTTGIEGILHYKDYGELLTREDITAIAIATPPNWHFAIALAALSAGKNVLVEKPPTLNINDLNILETVAQSAGLILYTAFHARHRPGVVAASRLLADTTIREVKINYHEPIDRLVHPNHWMLRRAISGGGVLMDNSINGLSVLRDLIPSIPIEIYGDGVSLDGSWNQVEYLASVPFTIGEGVGNLYSNWRKDPERIFSLATDTGEYTLDLIKGTLHRGARMIFATSRPFTLTDEYVVVYQDFIQHILSGQPLVRKDELKFVLDAYQAAYGNKL